MADERKNYYKEEQINSLAEISEEKEITGGKSVDEVSEEKEKKSEERKVFRRNE